MENEEPETGRQASRREEIQEIIDKRVEHLIRQSENPETGSPDASLGAGTKRRPLKEWMGSLLRKKKEQ